MSYKQSFSRSEIRADARRLPAPRRGEAEAARFGARPVHPGNSKPAARPVPLTATGKPLPMNEYTIQPLTPGPADGNPADGKLGCDSPTQPGLAERSSVLLGLAVALPATPVLLILGTSWQAIQFLWIVAVIWTVVASFVQALRPSIRHGDWSAFRCWEIPRNDADLDFATKTGRYAFLRIRASHEALTRAGDRYLQNQYTR